MSQEENQESRTLETKCKMCFKKGVWSALSNAAVRSDKMQIDR